MGIFYFCRPATSKYLHRFDSIQIHAFHLWLQPKLRLGFLIFPGLLSLLITDIISTPKQAQLRTNISNENSIQQFFLEFNFNKNRIFKIPHFRRLKTLSISRMIFPANFLSRQNFKNSRFLN